ncbi:MAG: hypothetical protein HKP61_00685 [Dactylosporangium sp.]|nr:hypothetical protein [Dactylosporangium sp.]NNJ59485.1 hypothetical protein [Dactylosporangium sp.]
MDGDLDAADRDVVGPGDVARTAASLARWVDRLTFADLDADAVTDLLIETSAAWATAQGWRIYRRAPSVVSLPPPYAHRRSCVDVGCARPAGAPVVVEIDHTARRRTLDKLIAEAAAGRVAIWLRWGSGGWEPPPEPVRLVTCPVTARRDPVRHHQRYSRHPETQRPAPHHSPVEQTTRQQSQLFSTPESG